MRVNFLSASDGVALSKTFNEIAPGTYKETSYPYTLKFNSIERHVETVHDFYLQIAACAKEGMSLIKGELDQPLINESRAGHTNASEETSWICLDVDYTVVDQHPEEFLRMLDPAFDDVSFVFQRSASMGIKSAEGWRGHIFILLDSPQSPPVLKQWLIQKNLTCTPLQSRVGLSASGGALTFPLDVTTCQNDKLIYIAAPTCLNFDDPIDVRTEYVERSKEAVSLDMSGLSAAANQVLTRKFLLDKRKALGLEQKTSKTTTRRGTEILTNPDPVMVTGKKEERGFVYINLNGGDSWGYFFPQENPELLRNFKGEPCMYMRDVDKDILDEYSSNTPTNSRTDSEPSPFGFLWADDDTYYRGFACPTTGELVWLKPVGSKGKLKDFLVQHGQPPGTGWAVPEWHLTFDPSTEGKADFSKQSVNTYKQTEYINNQKKVTDAALPPIINQVITSVCVDEETKNHFLNWLAAIYQTREKTNTAWIFQGVQGTGKGVLFTRVLEPLIGRDYCHEMTMDRLDDDFNAYLNENIVLFIDEANVSDSRNGDRLLNRVKNLVTEPDQHIRGMRKNAISRRNYSNIILASNHDEIIPLEISDRRFNVAPRQEKPIQLAHDDVAGIAAELPDFANFLYSFEVDQKAVKKVLLSEAREKLIRLSETTVASFFHAIGKGDLEYFTQYLDAGAKSDLDGIRYHDYALAVNRWIETSPEETNVSRNELRDCYQYLQSTSISATKFSRMCAKYGFVMVPIRIGDKMTRGLRGIRWALSEEELNHHKEQASGNVLSFAKKDN